MPVATVTLSGAALHGVAPHLIPQHLMAQLPKQVRLGAVLPKARPPVLRLADYLRPGYTLPNLPVDWTAKAMPALSQMYLNDTYGCCVISDAYHRVGVWTGNDSDSGGIALGTDAEVLATYRIWNPGNQDNGCVITQVLDYCRDHGITVGGVNHKIDGYVAIDWTNWDEVQIALFLFGTLPLGIRLPQAWTQQSIWDVTNSPIVGGHDVPCVAKMAAGKIRISSWGRLFDITQAAFTSRNWIQEAYAVLSPDWYGKDGLAPNFIDVAALRADLQKIAGGVIPDVGPTPTPPPTPVPPVPPTPGPHVNPIQQMIDGLFAQLEAAVQSSSLGFLRKNFALVVLRQLQQAIDGLFSKQTGVGAEALSPSQVKELADAVLGMLTTIFASNPLVASIISAIKLAVDSFLSQQAAPLLAYCPDVPGAPPGQSVPSDLGPPPGNWR